MRQKTENRAKDILHLLLQQGTTSVEQLADHFKTSTASIRRDLARLEQNGLVHRTHGGAMLAQQTYEPFRFDASFTERKTRFERQKQAIGAYAATLIVDGEFVGLTAGSTTAQVARSIVDRSSLRILTNAMNIGLELGSPNGPEVTLTGGCMTFPSALSLTGPAALETIGRYTLDQVILGVTGIDPRFGATIIQNEEAAISRAMVRQSRRVVVVADSSKVGMTSHAVICTMQQVDVLITDGGITDQARVQFEQQGAHLIIVPA